MHRPQTGPTDCLPQCGNKRLCRLGVTPSISILGSHMLEAQFCLHAAWLLIEIKHAGYSRLIPHQCKGCSGPLCRPSCPGTLHLLSMVCAAAMLVVPSAFGQPLRATVVHIEGVQDTWRVTDKDGKIVEVHVPAQSLINIQTSQEERPGASGTSNRCEGRSRPPWWRWIRSPTASRSRRKQGK